ncbi:MAG TPA: PTS glucose transporter subunit IIA, partial [Symbiobacteriaceae bacterium]|nr:PTS glucose transporter subunit IIA [Symbiobacteriaceae bacterium]
AALRALGASAVLRVGGGDVQVVVGARAGQLAAQIRSAMGTGTAPAAPTVTLLSPLSGRVVLLEQVPDPVFSGRLAGDGVAVEAAGPEIVAPAAGEVVHVFPGGHALGILTPEGLELLVHVGLDTVALAGAGFSPYVKAGDKVTGGQLMGRCDPELIAAHGKVLVSPVLVTNAERVAGIEMLVHGDVQAGEPLMVVRLKA